MIEYLYKEGEEPCSKEPLKVRLDGRIVGEIVKVDGGFQYFPKYCMQGGEILNSVADVQSALSGEKND